MVEFKRGDEVEKELKVVSVQEKRKLKGVLVLFVAVFVAGFLIAYLLYSDEDWPCAVSVVECSEGMRVVPLVDREYFEVVFDALGNAGERIDVMMFEFRFYDNEENKVRQFADALIGAVSRGVEVRVLLDESDWNPDIGKKNKVMKRYLESNGVDVRLDSPKKTLHTKVIVIDDSVIVGSTNWGFYALERNREASVLIESLEVADYYDEYFEFVWEES